MEMKMKTPKKWIAISGMLPLILLLSGCFCVEVKNNVRNPDKYFNEAHRQINRLHRQYPNRRGPVSTINVLVYEKSERQLIRVEAPLWLIDAGMDYCDTYDIDTDCDFKFEDIDNLRDIGPGMLMEADSEDSMILIWIE